MNSVLHQSCRGNIDPRGALSLSVTNPRALSGLLNGTLSSRKGVSSGLVGQEAGSTWRSQSHPEIAVENANNLALSGHLSQGLSCASPVTHQHLGSTIRSTASSSGAGNTL